MPHPGSPPTLKRFFDRVVRRSFGDLALTDDPAAEYLSGHAGILTYVRKVYFRPDLDTPDLPFFRRLITAW